MKQQPNVRARKLASLPRGSAQRPLHLRPRTRSPPRRLPHHQHQLLQRPLHPWPLPPACPNLLLPPALATRPRRRSLLPLVLVPVLPRPLSPPSRALPTRPPTLQTRPHPGAVQLQWHSNKPSQSTASLVNSANHANSGNPVNSASPVNLASPANPVATRDAVLAMTRALDRRKSRASVAHPVTDPLLFSTVVSSHRTFHPTTWRLPPQSRLVYQSLRTRRRLPHRSPSPCPRRKPTLTRCSRVCKLPWPRRVHHRLPRRLKRATRVPTRRPVQPLCPNQRRLHRHHLLRRRRRHRPPQRPLCPRPPNPSPSGPVSLTSPPSTLTSPSQRSLAHPRLRGGSTRSRFPRLRVPSPTFLVGVCVWRRVPVSRPPRAG